MYGFNKLFKWQFYLPEPNTLFTTLGNTYRDLLYWSTMGSSHSYNIFLGLTEIIAAVLLFFRRTRIAGSLLAIGILVNIVMVNFSFDISVKVYSLFLLLLAVVIAVPDGKRLSSFFFNVPAGNLIINTQPAPTAKYFRWLKAAVILYVFASVLYVYIKSENYNDDLARRPPFHGAYEVELFINGGDTIPPLITDSYRWRRVFVHRQGYVIIQGMNDGMQDYLFVADTINRKWIMKNESTGKESEFLFSDENGKDVILRSAPGPDSLIIYLSKIDLSSLPLLQKEFNWTIDP